jgi:exopolyphosphatase/pppGpp-phosphohydrolase
MIRNNRVAVIEVGSRAVRLLVADVVSSGRLDVVATDWEETGLAGAAAAGNIAIEQKIEDISTTLTRFRTRAEEYHPKTIAAIGTDAIRKLDRAYIDRLRNVQKDFVVLSEKQEADLSFVTGVMSFPETAFQDGRSMVIDQGSGSMEVIVGRTGAEGPRLAASNSYPLGTTELVKLLRAAGATNGTIPQSAVDAVGTQVSEIFAKSKRYSITTRPIVLGSVATKVAWMDVRKNRLAPYDPRAVQGIVVRLGHLHRLISASVQDFAAMRQEIDPRRPDSSEPENIIAGSIGLQVFLERQGKTEMVVCAHGTRYGVIWKLMLAAQRAVTPRTST